jgi:hypothetical protein
MWTGPACSWPPHGRACSRSAPPCARSRSGCTARASNPGTPSSLLRRVRSAKRRVCHTAMPPTRRSTCMRQSTHKADCGRKPIKRGSAAQKDSKTQHERVVNHGSPTLAHSAQGSIPCHGERAEKANKHSVGSSVAGIEEDQRHSRSKSSRRLMPAAACGQSVLTCTATAIAIEGKMKCFLCLSSHVC